MMGALVVLHVYVEDDGFGVDVASLRSAVAG
jgi:hypothetical protein